MPCLQARSPSAHVFAQGESQHLRLVRDAAGAHKPLHHHTPMELLMPLLVDMPNAFWPPGSENGANKAIDCE